MQAPGYAGRVAGWTVEELRALVRTQISTLPPPVDLRERRSRTRLLRELDRLANPFDRLAGPVHVTASAVVLGPRGVLLHRHRRLDAWLQPGGHLEPGEAPWEAARREAWEETGLLLRAAGTRPLHVDVHPGPLGHTHLDLRYLFRAADREPRAGPGESREVAWFPWPAALAVADVGLLGARRAAGAGTAIRPGARPGR